MFRLHRHIKTKLYAICASFWFACSLGSLNNKMACESNEKQKYHSGGTAPKPNRKIVEEIDVECQR